MTVYLGGGHEEHMFDATAWFARAGYVAREPGIYGEHEGKRGPRTPLTTEEEHHHQHAVSHAVREYAAEVTPNQLACFLTRPSVHEFVMDRAGESAKWLAQRFDICYAILGAHACVFAPLMSTIWHFNGQMHQGYGVVAQQVLDHGGRVVCYCEQEADLFPGMRLPAIPFGKDPEEWHGWEGVEPSVLYVANALPRRAEACHFETFKRTIIPGKWWLGGKQNEELGDRARCFPFDEFKRQMRRSRAFFNLGTIPAAYTLGVIEAAMTGMPILTEWYEHPEGCAPYSVPDLLGGGCIAWRTATPAKVERVIGDGWRAQRRREVMSRKAREAAVKHFALDKVAAQWRTLISNWQGEGDA